jgi:hypothetical protein
MHCGSCGGSLDDGAAVGRCLRCGQDRLREGRFLLLEPIADGSQAVDLEQGERVRLWQARRFVPEGVELVGELWVSNTASEARVLEAMAPMEDLFAMGWEEPPELPERRRGPPLAATPGRRWWRRLRPVVMAGMMLGLVPLGIAASPPPPDYGAMASAPPAFAGLVDEVRGAPDVQACLVSYRAKVRVQDVAYPALLVVEGSPTPSLRPTVRGTSGDPELTACVVAAAGRLPFPTGTYTASVPVGEEALP